MNVMKKLTVFVIIVILVLVSFVFVVSNYNSSPILKFNGIEISSNNYKSITEPLPEGRFILCSIRDNKCNLMFKGKLE